MNIIKTFVRARLARGAFQGNPFWMAVGAAVAARRLVRWVVGRRQEVVFRGTVKPGETLTITHRQERWQEEAALGP